MGEALGWAGEVGSGPGGERIFAVAEDEVAAHSGGEVEDDIGFGVADAVHDFAVEGGVARGFSAFGVADMNVRDGGAGFGGVNGGGGNLGGRFGDEVAASGGVSRAG